MAQDPAAIGRVHFYGLRCGRELEGRPGKIIADYCLQVTVGETAAWLKTPKPVGWSGGLAVERYFFLNFRAHGHSANRRSWDAMEQAPLEEDQGNLGRLVKIEHFELRDRH
jgi:hypothetical protein